MLKVVQVGLTLLQFALVVFSFWWITRTIDNWSIDKSIVSSMNVLLSVWSASLGAKAFLELFENTFAKRAANAINVIDYCYIVVATPINAFLLVQAVMFLLLFMLLSGLQALGILPIVADKAVSYLAFVIASIIFVNKGKNLVALLASIWPASERERQYSTLLTLLSPNLMRLYVYGILAVTYVIANVEKFSGVSFMWGQWWIDYKDVMLEVLLTVVTFDGLAVLWKEQKARAKSGEGHAG